MTGHFPSTNFPPPAVLRKHRADRIREMFRATARVLREYNVTGVELARASGGEIDVQSCYRLLTGKSLPRADLFEAFFDAVSVVLGDATITVDNACAISGLAKVELRDFVTGYNLKHPENPIRYLGKRINYNDLLRAINKSRRVKTERVKRARKQEIEAETTRSLSLLLAKGGLADT